MLHFQCSMKSRFLASAILTLVVAAAGALVFSPDGRSVLRLLSSSKSAQAPSVVFAVIGDTEGHADIYRTMVEEARSRGARFILHTGDVASEATRGEFLSMKTVTEDSHLPVFVAPGNHDVGDETGRAFFTSVFNNTNFAFDEGNFRFLILDNADRKVGFSVETLSWLEHDLRDHPDARYVIAFHRPFNLPLSSLLGDDETPASRASDARFIEIVRSAHVESYFTGHLHLYLPYRLDGIQAYVTGGGGGEPQPSLGLLNNQQRHFLLVRGNEHNLEVEVVWLENA